MSSRAKSKVRSRKSPRIYCGNNRYADELRNGAVIGTRYKCMQIGVGKGLNLPANPKYLGRYKAITESNIWCGNSRAPRGKQNGTNPQCLQKGFGIGCKLKATRELGGRRRPRMRFDDDVESMSTEQLEAELMKILSECNIR